MAGTGSVHSSNCRHRWRDLFLGRSDARGLPHRQFNLHVLDERASLVSIDAGRKTGTTSTRTGIRRTLVTQTLPSMGTRTTPIRTLIRNLSGMSHAPLAESVWLAAARRLTHRSVRRNILSSCAGGGSNSNSSASISAADTGCCVGSQRHCPNSRGCGDPHAVLGS